MDPETVVAEARGAVDEALLAGTGGGFLGRAILADDPLIAHLRDVETLHYLLSGPTAPTRIEDGRPDEVDTRGSYLTLVAVTDGRVLVVVGSEDGDRRYSFPYGDLVAVGRESGLLTETVVLDVGPDVTWRIEVASGSDLREAVAYARQQLSNSATERSPDVELVDVVFRSLVGPDDRTLDVQQYGTEELDALVADLDAHRERVEAHLAHDEPDAARGAAATVEAIAAEGERLAEASGDPRLARRISASRRAARRAVVADAYDVADPADLGAELDRTLERLLVGMDPETFEHLVADVWSGLGYQTTVGASRRDRGGDVVARRTSPVEQTVVIEAERIAPERTVGREAIQEYASLYRQEPAADLVVVVTTGSFTEPAVETATALGVKLVDGDRLVEVVAERGLHDVVASHVRP